MFQATHVLIENDEQSIYF